MKTLSGPPLLPALSGAILSVLLLASALPAFAEESVASFFEPGFPFIQTAVDLTPKDAPKDQPRHVVVRGILLPQPDGSSVLFDQELLRMAAWWSPQAGQPPLTPASMSQASYAEPHRKAGKENPAPTSVPLQFTSATPGVATSKAALASDPRPTLPPTEYGRGPLPADSWHFDGLQLQDGKAVLQYRCGKTQIREWYETNASGLTRHLEVAPHSEPLFLNLAQSQGETWTLSKAKATSGHFSLRVSQHGTELQLAENALLLSIAPATVAQKIALQYSSSEATSPTAAQGYKPAGASQLPRWTEKITVSSVQSPITSGGLTLDPIPLPMENPWNRRIRPADMAFLDADKAAVVTYDGDVWVVEGLGKVENTRFTWRRFASGLNEPLSIASVGGTLQVHTRNGLVRLYDRAGKGEADWYENFADSWVQSSSNRAFPLDMAVTSDGSTYISQGALNPTLNLKPSSPFAGAISRVSPDGKKTEIIASRAREPYFTVHPRTGTLTATDQQGHFIPSSVCYLVRQGNDFGFGDEKPAQLTPPLTWIPHTEDNSCASQVWLDGDGMGPLNGRLMHLSYGRGVPFLICPDLDAPVPQGAVIPLDIPTNIPLLHGRMHPSGDSVFLAGFQIYDSRTTTNWAFGRLRLSGTPLPTPIDARSCKDGVLITFASPLDPASVNPDTVLASSWNYLRSKAYGSGRYNKQNQAGSDQLPVGQVLLSKDERTVFVHLPGLEPVQQLQLNHEFRLKDGTPAKGNVYFTIHQPRPLALETAGFENVDLGKSVPLMRLVSHEAPTATEGETISKTMGCVACHSTDGATEGKTGPTWKGLFGKDRIFTDGSMESANEFYIRTSILEPQKKIVKGYAPGMASYQGILSDDQIASIILYIKTLK